MAATMTGIWNQPSTMHKTITATRETDTSPGSTASDSGSASISANDFLALLVTEMKNQDPTANTDPNEYINQLVQVNSLEQLISINQTLTADSAASADSNSAHAQAALPSGSVKSELSSATVHGDSPTAAKVVEASGNLSSPRVNRAAIRVAQALGNN